MVQILLEIGNQLLIGKVMCTYLTDSRYWAINQSVMNQIKRKDYRKTTISRLYSLMTKIMNLSSFTYDHPLNFICKFIILDAVGDNEKGHDVL